MLEILPPRAVRSVLPIAPPAEWRVCKTSVSTTLAWSIATVALRADTTAPAQVSKVRTLSNPYPRI